MYQVIVRHPDGGDVIEGRHAPIVKEFSSLKDAIEETARWYRRGPNGPVRSAELYRDGIRLDLWEEIERAGMTPLVSKDYAGRRTLVSCE